MTNTRGARDHGRHVARGTIYRHTASIPCYLEAVYVNVDADGLTMELPMQPGTFLMLPWMTVAIALLIIWLLVIAVYYAARGVRGNRE